MAWTWNPNPGLLGGQGGWENAEMGYTGGSALIDQGLAGMGVEITPEMYAQRAAIQSPGSLGAYTPNLEGSPEGMTISGRYNTLSPETFKNWNVFNYLGYSPETRNALWNTVAKDPTSQYAQSIINANFGAGQGTDYSGAYGNDYTANLAAGTSTLAPMLKELQASGGYLNPQEASSTMNYWGPAREFWKQQQDPNWSQQYMPMLASAIMAVGTGGVMGGAMGALAAGAANAYTQGSTGDPEAGLWSGLNSAWGAGMMPGATEGMTGALTEAGMSPEAAAIGGKAGSSATMAGIQSGGDPSAMGQAALTGGAGVAGNQLTGQLGSDSTWGTGGNMNEGDMWGTQSDWNNYDWGGGGGNLYATDIPQGYSVDGMAGTGEAIPTSGGGINWGGLATGAGSMLLNAFLGGGGGGTAPTGTGGANTGTVSQTGGGTPAGINLFNSIYDFNSLDRSSNAFKSLIDQMKDPYAPYRAGAAQGMNQLLTDPTNNPYWKAMRDYEMNQLQARDAAAGQLFNSPERANELMGTMARNLPNLASPYLAASGASTSPSAYGVAQAEAMKPWSQLEQKKAQAVGQATSSGGQILNQVLGGMDLSQLQRWLQQFGGTANA